MNIYSCAVAGTGKSQVIALGFQDGLQAIREVAIAGIAQTALSALLAAQVEKKSIETIKTACMESPYWAEFCLAVKGGFVQDGWISGIIGFCVKDWAVAS